MNKKIIYAMLIVIIIASAILSVTLGFKLDSMYDENTKIYVYIGKQFENEEIKQIAQEVFETDNIKIQMVEVYEDMVCIILPKQEKDDKKIETLNTKLNEKFEIKNKVEDIEVTNSPKLEEYTIIKPYIIPTIISTIIILGYVSIMYRKLGVIKTIVTYILAILAPMAVYIATLILAKIPLNPCTIAIGLIIYSISIMAITITKQKQLEIFKLNEK